MGASGVLIGLILSFYVAIPLAFSIASIVIGSQNLDATCDDASFIPLSTWLFAYGGVQLFFVVTGIIAVVLLIMDHASAFILWVVGLILASLFMLAWNIVGAVALFRDSPSCMDNSYSLWAMTLAVLIIQWISLFVSCCTGTRTKQES